MAAPAGDVALGPFPSRCKKKDGTLSVTVDRLVFTNGDGSGEVIIEFRDMQSRQVSPKTSEKAKAVVKLIVRNGSKLDTIFVELTCPTNRWTHQRALSKWMTAREQETKEMEESLQRDADVMGSRMKVVLDCPSLREKYTYLVKTKQTLSQDEFFAAHEADIAMRMPLPEAPQVNLAALQTASSMARRVGGTGYALPASEVANIFRELPELKKLYGVAVPTMLNSAQFWERCFASRFYREAMGQNVPPTHPEDPLFDALERSNVAVGGPSQGPKEVTKALSAGLLGDLHADLTGEAVSERDRDEAARPRKKGCLLERLNERSAAVLSHVLTSALPGAAAEGDAAGAPGSAAPADAPPGGGQGQEAAAAGAGAEQARDPAELLRRTVSGRRDALKRMAENLRDDVEGAGQGRTKAARLRLQGAELGSSIFGVGDHGRPRADPNAAGTREATGPEQEALQAVRAWAGAAQSRRLTPPNREGAKMVAVEATVEMYNDAVVQRRDVAGGSPQELPRDVAEAANNSLTLLRHFWGSRWTEKGFRERLSREMAELLAQLERWQSGPERAARSFAAPLRVAAALRVDKAAAATTSMSFGSMKWK